MYERWRAASLLTKKPGTKKEVLFFCSSTPWVKAIPQARQKEILAASQTSKEKGFSRQLPCWDQFLSMQEFLPILHWIKEPLWQRLCPSARGPCRLPTLQSIQPRSILALNEFRSTAAGCWRNPFQPDSEVVHEWGSDSLATKKSLSINNEWEKYGMKDLQDY